MYYNHTYNDVTTTTEIMSITSEEDSDPTTLSPPHNSSRPPNPISTLSSSSELLSDTSSSSELDDDDPTNLPPPPFSHTFAPPFYGRPPTPLPPSPSLTSLLRPSRPTTPDASDDETGALNHDPVPRAAPKVPTYEYYGFVLYLFSSLCFGIYLLWSYLPSPFLHALGIYYYPNRWWSLAIPSFLVMSLVYIYVALASYNTEVLTLPLKSIETVVDEAANVAVVDSRGRIREGERRKKERRVREGRERMGGGANGREREKEKRERREERMGGGKRGGLNWREVWNEGTDAVMDVPLAGVCEVLYGEGREEM